MNFKNASMIAATLFFSLASIGPARAAVVQGQYRAVVSVQKADAIADYTSGTAGQTGINVGRGQQVGTGIASRAAASIMIQADAVDVEADEGTPSREAKADYTAGTAGQAGINIGSGQLVGTGVASRAAASIMIQADAVNADADDGRLSLDTKADYTAGSAGQAGINVGRGQRVGTGVASRAAASIMIQADAVNADTSDSIERVAERPVKASASRPQVTRR